MSPKEKKYIIIGLVAAFLYFAYQANQNGTGPLSGWSLLGGQAG